MTRTTQPSHKDNRTKLWKVDHVLMTSSTFHQNTDRFNIVTNSQGKTIESAFKSHLGQMSAVLHLK